jgi:hypothetical protein
MVSDEEVLARARATWQDAAPTDAEVHQGAQRLGRRLRSHRRASSSRTMWTLAGSVAAFMATLAYAGIGHRSESEDAVTMVRSGETSGSGSGTRERAIAGELRDRLTAFAFGASRASADGPAAPSQGSPPRAPDVTAAPSAGLDEVGSTQPAGAVPMPPATGDGDRTQPAGSRSTEASRSRSKARAPLARGGDDPSWRAVSDALAAGKQWRAEQLLTRLAERGGDANTRAKAKLGLGQLEASRGRCSKARQLALAVAGQSGIETKTVRRALELAARCLR